MGTTGLTALNVSMNTSDGKDAIAPSAAARAVDAAITQESAITAEEMDARKGNPVFYALCAAHTRAS